MAITASEITTANTLEQLRGEFNNLITDVSGLEAGTSTFTAITATTSTATTVNVAEDGTIVFEGATSDAYETTLTVTDPTADRTITLPNATGTVTLGGNPSSADGEALGSTSLEWSDLYIADGGVIYFGDDQDVTLTHVHDTGLLLNSTMAIQFNDSSQYINAPSNAILDINATDEIELNATLADVNANLDVSGTYQGGGTMTTGGNIIIPNDGNIGSASDTDAIAIGSTGIVTLSSSLVVSGSATLSGPYHTLTTNSQLRFRDSDIHIQSNADGDLDITADDEIELNSTLIDINGNVEISGTTTLSSDISVIGGALLKMSTNTAGYLLVGDGTSYEEVAVSGDVTMASGGAVTIAANAVEGSMLNTDTISAQTALTSGLETTDELLVSDAGTLKRMDVSVLSTLTDGNATALAIALG